MTSGANLQGLNLPIDPNGVVYNSVARSPVAGATLTLLSAGSGAPLPTSCLDDAAQQGQVTLADGYYKFDINFSDPACPSGGEYLIGVTAPDTTYVAGYSQIIPPTSSASTPALSVPACPASTDDALPATALYCEAQPSEFAPAVSIAARSAGTNYHVHLRLDGSQLPGSSQIFNNHIPLDPELSGAVAISKTTPLINVTRGQLVPYVITVNNVAGLALTDVRIVDRFPAGFTYVEGSARVDGVPTEPTVAGLELVWDGLALATSAQHTVQLLLAVGAGVTEGEYVNRAQVALTVTGNAISGEATATVRVVPDPTFDCTDVTGKVFDDANRNGLQEDGELGLPGVRLVTARGLTATTDQYGRYHITCAVTPDEARGSNFVLKLDDRTLPSGFRMSTDQLQVKRATRGKALRFNFGASIHRVVGIDLADAAFEPGSTEIRIQWRPRIDLLLKELRKAPAVLRLSYVADIEDAALVDRRMQAVKKQITDGVGGDELLLPAHHRARSLLAPRCAAQAARRTRPGQQVNRMTRHHTVLLLAFVLPSLASAEPLALPGKETLGEPVERHLSGDQTFQQWTQDPALLTVDRGDRLEKREVVGQAIETVKLRNVVPPIRFESGVAKIPPNYVDKLAEVLEGVSQRTNVRVHFVGHADSQQLSGDLVRVFEDNAGLSRERAGEVAEYFKTALALAARCDRLRVGR